MTAEPNSSKYTSYKKKASSAARMVIFIGFLLRFPGLDHINAGGRQQEFYKYRSAKPNYFSNFLLTT
jgi:hypothetical protein